MLVTVFITVFLVGTLTGAVLNYCADRLPFEKSLLWPGLRCSRCLRCLPWRDRIPLLSFWLAGRHCRFCANPWPWRSFLVELGTGFAFMGLVYLDLFVNVLDLGPVRQQQANIRAGHISFALWLVVGHHALLVSLLVLISVCDLDHLEIPLGITITGTFLGLASSMLVAWPFPAIAAAPGAMPRFPGSMHWIQQPLQNGVYPWPIWDPLPSWLPPGSWQLGLTTSLAGAAMGMLIVRVIRFLFGLGRGIEGLGLGDADLMMMAGSFVGWQPVLFGFFAGILPALVFAMVQIVRKGDEPIPFGPSLGIGVLLVLFNWPAIAAWCRPMIFDATIMGSLFGLGAVFLLVTAFLLRLVRGTEQGAVS
jgi:leader peptidase (prepilin peptidase) / N-methyltransferase